MLFNSISYLVFLPAVVLIYWLSPNGRPRQLVLLLASYLFYMSWIPQYGLLLLILTVVNYGLGIWISRLPGAARYLFVLGIAVNLLALCYYKYANFLIQSVVSLFQFTSLTVNIPPTPPDLPLLHVILPLAISFFAFEFIHYLSDVYKGDKPIKNPLEFALFAAFFPSQIAGPIKRYQDFVEKLRKKPTFEPAMFNAGIALILQGLFKKVALADNLAILANTGFQNYASLGTFESWLAVLAFTFQIYFDFSGYTDMGRGSAMLLGIELPINFNLPYIASSVTDFWKRWHISLSTWLRDYLYIPLGGNRCSKARRQINLMVTMLLGGLWHGAAWHFVAWGMLHGAALIINHKYASIVETSKALQKAHQSLPARLTCIIVTFLFVVITWVFFRADTIAQASSILANMFSYSQSHVLAECLRSSLLPYALSTYLVYAIIFTPSTVSRPEWLNSITRSIFARPTLRIPCYVAAYFAAIGLSAPQVSAFIYFQF